MLCYAGSRAWPIIDGTKFIDQQLEAPAKPMQGVSPAPGTCLIRAAAAEVPHLVPVDAGFASVVSMTRLDPWIAAKATAEAEPGCVARAGGL